MERKEERGLPGPCPLFIFPFLVIPVKSLCPAAENRMTSAANFNGIGSPSHPNGRFPGNREKFLSSQRTQRGRRCLCHVRLAGGKVGHGDEALG